MRKLYVYAHTHWDREWYLPFETFRLQLVSVVRNVLDELESGGITRFYLDGQSILIEDVLEIDPGLEPRLQNAMQSGKLAVGPWYVLADQMLVGGESLVRNLKYGLETTTRLGPPSLIGYSPDTFGHSQDLPRILSGFGIRTAAVWRGVPLLEMGPAFWWKSPDGSRVLAYHFSRGYYQTAFHEAVAASANGGAKSAQEKLASYLLTWVDSSAGTAAARPYYKAIDGALMPAGADHVGPPAGLSKLIKTLNQSIKKSSQAEIVATTLGDFLSLVQEKITGKGINIVQGIEGELRSNSAAPYYERAYMLYGVLSSRLYLKRANRLAEYALARVCEPLFALLNVYGFSSYPSLQIDHAWKLLLKNHPHDSICGCSVDEVHREMMTRYSKLDDMLRAIFAQADAAVAGPTTTGGVSPQDPAYGCQSAVVFNLSSSPVTAPVPFKWTRELDATPIPLPVQVTAKKRVDRLFSGWGIVPYYKEVDEFEGWLWPGTVPPTGCAVIPFESAVNDDTPGVSVRPKKLSNGLLEISVTPGGKLMVSHTVPGASTQTYRLNHEIRDVGDGGDSYNFDPISGDKPVVAKFAGATVGQSGPLVGSIVLTYEIDLPENAVPDGGMLSKLRNDLGRIEPLKRSGRKLKHTITTEVTLRRGVPLVFFDMTFENRSKDHRLEVVFDTEKPVKTTVSENHFSVVHRTHGTRSSKNNLPVPLACEAPLDRFPAQRFFLANDQAFFNCGLPEYAVEGTTVSITLLRAFSWLSKPQLWTRGGGAGPNVEVPEGNALGINRCSYGWAPLPGQGKAKVASSATSLATAYQLSEQFEGALWGSLSARTRLQSGSAFVIDNPNVRLVSLFCIEQAVVARLLNVSLEPQKTKISAGAKGFTNATVANLGGSETRSIEIKNNQFELILNENELATVELKF